MTKGEFENDKNKTCHYLSKAKNLLRILREIFWSFHSLNMTKWGNMTTGGNMVKVKFNLNII